MSVLGSLAFFASVIWPGAAYDWWGNAALMGFALSYLAVAGCGLYVAMRLIGQLGGDSTHLACWRQSLASSAGSPSCSELRAAYDELG